MIEDLPSAEESNGPKQGSAESEQLGSIANTNTIAASADPDDSKEHKNAAQRHLQIAYKWCRFTTWQRGIKPFIASSNFWIATATVVIAIATGVYTIYARKQWQVMRRQLTEMQIARRPWVGSGPLEFKQPVFLVYPDNPIEARTQVDVLVEIPIKNFGLAPAFHVDIELAATMTAQTAAPASIGTEMEFACHSADNNAKNGGEALFPNGPETSLEIPASIMVPFIQIAEIRRVWIAICVAYSDVAAGEKLHHTRILAASWPISGQPREIRRTTNPRVIYYSLPITQWGVVKTEAD